MAILTTKDLCKTYGSGDNAVHALNHVSLTVEEGEFVSIVGTSGSGKSTFLNLVGGLETSLPRERCGCGATIWGSSAT